MAGLPEAALLVVSRIEAMLDEATRLIERTGVADDVAFSLKETERRYLPDTLNAYLNVPASRRDAVADSLLLDQLELLERATAQRLATLTQSGSAALAANGAFLAERFGAPDALPEPHSSSPATGVPAVPRALVARFFADLQTPDRSNPVALLEAAGSRFGAVFPSLTSVRRGLFGGPAKSVALDIPLGSDVLRYTLEADRGGVVAAVTKIVRGVALRTERIDLDQWIRGLFEDVSTYVERDRSTREALTKFLSG